MKTVKLLLLLLFMSTYSCSETEKPPATESPTSESDKPTHFLSEQQKMIERSKEIQKIAAEKIKQQQEELDKINQ